MVSTPAPSPSRLRCAPARRYVAALALGAALLALAGFSAPARAADNPDVQHLHFRYGPLAISPGQNLILIGPNVQKPSQDGYIVRMKPDLQREDGSVPPVDVIHLHHGVWLNASASDTTNPGLPQRFYGAGEEKTIMLFPAGYGYPVHQSDAWLLNYMIHNLTPNPESVYITYDVDFVPADSPTGKTIKPVRPVWLDVRNGEAYPVFDVHRGRGTGGTFTYPDQAPDAYPAGTHLNEWTVDHAGTLIATAGHVHPGGLRTDLDLVRAGAQIAGAGGGSGATGGRCTNQQSSARGRTRRRRHRRRAARRARGRARGAAQSARRHRRRRHRGRQHRRARGECPSPSATSAPSANSGRPVPGSVPNSVHLFRSTAHYYDPNGPVSWDMSMPGTDPSWRVGVKPGDKLRVSATYDSRRASWYESMGIMVAYMADDSTGVDPFKTGLDQNGVLTHGQLPEATHYGGGPLGLSDPTTLGDGQPGPGPGVGVAGFSYLPGDQASSGTLRNPPVIHRGEQLTFLNSDAQAQVFHTITSCQSPCNYGTGVSYPLANGNVEFDSGELGYGPSGLTAASNRVTWSTPNNLPSGTYTYFCRIHPYMRGSFRVAQ